MPLTHDEHAELQRLLAKANEMPPVPSDVLEELAEYDAETGLFVNPITGDVSDVWDCDFSASHGAMTDGSKRREDEMCQPVSKRMMVPKAKVVPKPHHAGEPSLPAYAPVGVCVEAPFPKMGAEQGFEPVVLPAFPEGITDVKTWGMTVIAFGQFKDKEMSYEELVQSEESRCVSYDWGVVLPKLQMVTTSPSLTDAQQKAKEIAPNLTICCDQLVASMAVATYSVAHGVTTCGDMKARVSAEEWLTAIESSEAQNYLVARATQLFMQIALGFEVSQSQVDLTVLTESVGQDLRKLIEGSIAQQLVVPPEQEIVDLLFAAQAAWINLETELKKSVRSADIPSTSIKEVARLSRLALDNMGSAVKLYVNVALSSGTDAPVYQLDIASAQRTAIAKLAKETSLLSYGYDPQNSWVRFNYTRQSFVSNHWKLMKGYPASGGYPALPKTTNICTIQQMAIVLTNYELLEIAALEVALGDAARLQEVVKRTPEVVQEMELAMNQFSGLNTTCGPVSFSKEQWQGLITEVGLLRSWSQEAAVRFILQNEFNQTTVSLSAVLQESELRLKFGSRDPLVPPPISQAMFDEVAEHLEPKLNTLIAALAGSDSQQVHYASVSLSEETKKVKKEFLQDALASNPNKPVLRIDLASQQIMLSWQIFKESLMLKANLNSTAAEITSSLAAFESAQQHLKDGGGGIPAVIRNRFDIFKQWDKVMASWQVFKDLILSNAASIAETQVALDSLVIDLQVALELYTIPDEPLRADTVWPIIAYSAIAVFVLFVACCACLVFCSLRKKKDKELAEV
eukprot:s70_g51.t1